MSSQEACSIYTLCPDGDPSGDPECEESQLGICGHLLPVGGDVGPSPHLLLSAQPLLVNSQIPSVWGS